MCFDFLTFYSWISVTDGQKNRQADRQTARSHMVIRALKWYKISSTCTVYMSSVLMEVNRWLVFYRDRAEPWDEYVRHVWWVQSVVCGRSGWCQRHVGHHLHSSSAGRRIWRRLRPLRCRASRRVIFIMIGRNTICTYLITCDQKQSRIAQHAFAY